MTWIESLLARGRGWRSVTGWTGGWPLTPGALRRAAAVAFALVLAGALLVRVLESRHGLPYVDHWDEPAIASRAIEIMQTGDFNPRFFNYGSLLIYLDLGVDVAHFFYARSLPEDHPDSLSSMNELEIGLRSEPWFISHPGFYLWNRWLTAIFGVVAVAAVWSLSRVWAGPGAALLAAAFLATVPWHVEHSAMITADIPASTLALLALLFAVRFDRGARLAPLFAAAVCCGLATTTKYNYAVVFLVLLLVLAKAALQRSEGYRPWLWLAVPGVVGLSFFAGTPYALLDLRRFLENVGHTLHNYSVVGNLAGFNVEPGLEHLLMQTGMLGDEVGWVPLLVAGWGLVRLTTLRSGWIPILAAVLQVAVTIRTGVLFHRNLMLLYPIVALGVGLGLVDLGRRLVGRLSRRWRGDRVALTLVAAALLWMALRLTLVGLDSLSTARSEDSRSRAVTEILSSVDPQSSSPPVVGIARELRLHPQDRRRLEPFDVVEAPTLELACRVGARGLLVTGLAHAGASEPGAASLAAHLDEVVSRRPAAVISFGERKTNVDRFSVDPRLAVWPVGTFPDPGDERCGLFAPLALASGERLADRIELDFGDRLTTAGARVWPGSYELQWNERDLTPDRRRPTLVISLRWLADEAGGEEARTLVERPFASRPAGRRRSLPFEVSEPGRVSIGLLVPIPEDGEEGPAVALQGLQVVSAPPSPPGPP